MDLDNGNIRPFVKLLVPAGAGILIGLLSGVGWVFAAVCCAVVWVAGLWVREGTGATVYPIAAVMLYFTAVTAYVREPVQKIGEERFVVAELTVLDESSRSGRWMRTTAVVTAFRGVDDGDWQEGDFRIQFQIDTCYTVAAGDRLVVKAWFNPYLSEEGSLAGLMLRRGIAGRMYAGSGAVVAHGGSGGGSLSFAKRLHNASVRKFARLTADAPSDRHPDNDANGITELKSDGLSVAAAMVTGDKRGIPPETRRNYTDGGGAHLLAVSGLHVGIVFLLVNLLLYFIPSLWRGHIVKNLVAVALVWLFAASAGLSPSVLRAAMMFTLAQFALAGGTLRDGVNILAASALFLLAMQPNLIADPSFVLSYSAVLAIILFFRTTYGWIRTGNRLADGILSIYVAGIAASLATAPFVAYWFGAVPLAGILVNPLVILTAHVIVAVGVVWLIWPGAPGGGVFAWILGRAADVQNGVMEWCAGLQWGTVEVKLPLASAMACYVLIILSALMLENYAAQRRKRVTLPL